MIKLLMTTQKHSKVPSSGIRRIWPAEYNPIVWNFHTRTSHAARFNKTAESCTTPETGKFPTAANDRQYLENVGSHHRLVVAALL
ncbi:hypothetical protein VV867_04895 [Pseudomonas sp. JH-2]|uniref:hypothetical protein n=1 Tax=Pseudomonas sp. JH-2 TaxID=3114998 RepID=UPI002E270870|nr:hypothetical protein [Pseudomonas sp. JH-2]